MRARGVALHFTWFSRRCRRALVEGNRVKCAGLQAWRVRRRRAWHIRQHVQVCGSPRFAGWVVCLSQLSRNDIGLASLLVSSIRLGRKGQSHFQSLLIIGVVRQFH